MTPINQIIRSNFFLCPYIPRIQYTYPLLASLGKFNEGGARLTRYSERIELNVFNQLSSVQLMGLLGPKDILR